MLREEAPIWVKRRIKRRMAKGRSPETVIRALMKHSRVRHIAEHDLEILDNVVLFPGATRRSTPELGAA